MGVRYQEVDESRPVSVVIVSNDTKFLSETLDSVSNQTYSLFEVVLVLNGNAIREREFYTEYISRKKILGRVIISEIEGIVRARNLGVNSARFDLICTIDSDDTMPPYRLQEQVNEFRRNSALVCVGGQLVYLGDFCEVDSFSYPTSYQNTVHSLCRQASLPQPGSMFLKKKFIEVGGYREIHPYIEDWDLWMRLSKIGEIYNLVIPTVGYRLHDNQSTKIHKEVIQRSSINLLFENLEILLKAHTSISDSPDSAWRKRILRESLQVLMGVQKSETSIRKRDLRRSLAGITYQIYIDRLKKGKYLMATCLGFLSAILDPKILENRLLKTWVGRKIAPGYVF